MIKVMEKLYPVEQHICRISFDDAYNIFFKGKEYKDNTNIMIEVHPDDAFVFVPGRPTSNMFHHVNLRKAFEFDEDKHSLLSYINAILGTNKTNLFYVREDHLMLRDRNDYDSDQHRDYLFRIDDSLMSRLMLSEEMLPIHTLRERGKTALKDSVDNFARKFFKTSAEIRKWTEDY